MRLILYIGLAILAYGAASQLGRAAHGSTANFLLLAVVMLGAAIFLTRRLCFLFGSISLLLGSVGPVAIWTFGALFIRGDSSGYGMLGTLLGFVFLPVGCGLVILGLCKK